MQSKEELLCGLDNMKSIDVPAALKSVTDLLNSGNYEECLDQIAYLNSLIIGVVFVDNLLNN